MDLSRNLEQAQTGERPALVSTQRLTFCYYSYSFLLPSNCRERRGLCICLSFSLGPFLSSLDQIQCPPPPPCRHRRDSFDGHVFCTEKSWRNCILPKVSAGEKIFPASLMSVAVGELVYWWGPGVHTIGPAAPVNPQPPPPQLCPSLASYPLLSGVCLASPLG